MDQSKKVLIFVDWFYPGYKAGGPIQSCKNIVDTLFGEFQFYIFTSDKDIGDTKSYDNVKINEWTIYNSTVKIFYATPSYCTLKNISHLVKEIKPDTVYLNSMFSVGFTIKPLIALKRNSKVIKKILAPRGMLHKGATQSKKVKKIFFLNILKYSGLLKNILFHATDNQEKEDIKSYFNNSIRVVKNIPNINYGDIKSITKVVGRARFIFVSRVHPKKNILFFIELLKEIIEFDIIFDIYGFIDDEEYWQKCQETIYQLQPNIVVNYRGTLPNEKVFETIQEYHVFVLPTLGENFGHSIFESLSAGRPVLLSDQTPWQNLNDYKAGWDIPLSKRDRFLESIKRIAKYNQQEFDELFMARRLMQKKSWICQNLKNSIINYFHE